MFIHSFKNTFKVLSRKRELFFWSLIFPIILGIFFKLAFSNITTSKTFEKIPVAVNEEILQDENFKDFIDSMEDENYFEVYKAKDKSILQDKNIVAYVEKEDEIFTKKSGIRETIVETILNTYIQKKALVQRVIVKNIAAEIFSDKKSEIKTQDGGTFFNYFFENMKAIINSITENSKVDIEEILKFDDHIKDISAKNMDPVNVYFYTLVGMQVMYGYSWGLYVIYQYEANLSTKAKRNAIAPVNKRVSLFSSILVAWIFNTAISLVFIFFLKNFLGVNFGEKLLPIIGLTILASLTGVSFGSLIGVSNKSPLEIKIGIGIAITMLLCFLAGMMVMQMKVIIQKSFPILNKINPVAIITDAIYSLYYYNSMDRFFENIIRLSGVTLAIILGTLFFMRGKQYENL